MNRIYFHPYHWSIKDLDCKDERNKKIKDAFHGFWFFVEGFNEENKSILVRIKYYPWMYVCVPSNSIDDLKAVETFLKRKISFKETQILEKKQPYYFGSSNVNVLKLTFYQQKTMYYVNKMLSSPIRLYSGDVKCSIYELSEDPVIKYHFEQKLNHSGWHYTTSYSKINEQTQISDFDQEIIVLDNSQVFLETDEEKIRQLGVPNPSILSFDIECNAQNEKAMPKPENPEDEVIMVCATYQNRKKEWSKYTITLNKSIKQDDVELMEVKDETDLCHQFCNLIRNLDPDIIIGHNVFKFDWKYLNIRYGYQTNKNLPYIGRYFNWKLIELGDRVDVNDGTYEEDEWESSAYSDQKMGYVPAPGRLQMDLLQIIQRSGFKLDSYSLNHIAMTTLGEGKLDMDVRRLFRLYKIAKESRQINDLNECKKSQYHEIQSIQSLEELTKLEQECMYEIDKYCVKDTELPIRIFEKINLWVNLVEDAKIVHVNIFDLYARGQGIRVFNQEYLELMSQNYIVIKIRVEKRKYKGAFVFTALTGYYKKVHCLDFAKLYPSIMIAYNICYTTFVKEEMFNPNPDIKDEDCNVFEWEEDDDDNEDEEEETKTKEVKKIKYRFRFVKPHVRKGVLPTLLERLADARDEAKVQLKKEKNEFMKIVLDKRQNNIKISMNSIYGNKGTNMAKMPLYEAAMCTTAKGRQLIHQTANFIESKYGVKVVYGDTDSVMFVNPIDEPSKFNCIYNHDTKQLTYEKGTGERFLIFNQKRYKVDKLNNYDKKLNLFELHRPNINYGTSMRFIAKEVSSLFPPPVMLEYEKTFRNYLLVGKKMYAGMLASEKNIEEYNEKKFFCRGLPIARRDNCRFLRETLKTIFLMIFKNQTKEEVFDYVLTRLENLLHGNVEIDDLYIYKKIGKEERYKSDTTDMLFFLKYLKLKGEDPQPGDRYEFLLSTANCKYKGEKYRTLKHLKDDKLEIDYLLYFKSYFAKPVQAILSTWEPEYFPKNIFSKIFDKFIEKTGIENVKHRFLEFKMSGQDVKNLPNKNQTSITDFFKKQ